MRYVGLAPARARQKVGQSMGYPLGREAIAQWGRSLGAVAKPKRRKEKIYNVVAQARTSVGGGAGFGLVRTEVGLARLGEGSRDLTIRGFVWPSSCARPAVSLFLGGARSGQITLSRASGGPSVAGFIQAARPFLWLGEEFLPRRPGSRAQVKRLARAWGSRSGGRSSRS